MGGAGVVGEGLLFFLCVWMWEGEGEGGGEEEGEGEGKGDVLVELYFGLGCF